MGDGEPPSPGLTKSLPLLSRKFRIANERGMFGNKRVEKTSKGDGAKIFFYYFFSRLRQKSLLKLALSGVAEYESGRENACGIGIRLMSNKKQGVGVVWRGKNGVERGDVEGLC